ncbi:MAG: hypothetical protein V2A34_14830 [Lentisphaerota bacterium]
MMKNPFSKIPRRKLVGASVLALWAAGLAAGCGMAFHHLLSGYEAHQQMKAEQVCEVYMAKGLALAHVYRFPDAMAYCRSAVVLAPNDVLRAQAGIAIGQVLMMQAQTQPRPYALEARQYFEAVVALNVAPEVKLKAYQGIINSSALLNDVREVDKACRLARSYATNNADQASVLLHQMDVFLEIGNWKDMQGLEPALQPFMKEKAWRQTFELKWATIKEQVLLRDAWFDQYMEDYPDQDRAEARRKLVQQTINEFQELSKSPDVMIRDDSLFRIARILSHEKQYREAQQYIQAFLENEPAIHLDETLLLLTRMAREEGETQTANELISTFLKRYRLSTQASTEFDAVVAQLEGKAQFSDALALIGQYINLPAAKPRLTKYLAKAAELANRIGRYDQGATYFKDLLSLNPDTKTLSSALLDQGTACIRRNDLAEGEKWLIYFLNRFPHDTRRADALYKLFEIKVRSKAYAADIILLGTTAVALAPSDSRAMDTLLVMARILEQVGLPAMAQEQYKKIGLLNVAMGAPDRKEPLSKAVGESMLGSARCLLQMGDVIKADHLLRELCGSFNVEPVKSEAAYWWGVLALDRGQSREAARRLALADTGRATPEISAKLQFEKNLMEINTGNSVTGAMEQLMLKLSDLPPTEYGDFLVRAYSVYFDKLAAERDVAGMRKLLTYAVSSPRAATLPLRVYYLKVAQIILEDQGAQAFISFLEDDQDLSKSAASGLAEARSYLLDEMRKIEEDRSNVDAFIAGTEMGGT